MIVIFYGKHSSDWMNVLSSELIPKLNSLLIPSKYISSIINIFTIDDLILYIKDRTNYKIIPLMESHIFDLHINNINSSILPSLEMVKIFSNKKLFSYYVESNNLTDYVPLTYKNYSETLSNSSLFIIKPYCENNGQNIKIKNKISFDDFNNNIIQEYITNVEEFVSHIVAINGSIKLCITYKYIFNDSTHIKTYPLNTNNVIKVNIDKFYIDIMEKFLRNCSYNGVCNIDFVIDNKGNIKIFEINPRFGGSLIRNDDKDLHNTLIKLLFQ